ncbi:serine/threonine protein kinase, partial [Candidatus Magnetomorum sp. HK-1]
DKFYMDKYPVTNSMFHKFIQQTNYKTDPEKKAFGRVRHGSKWEKMKGLNWSNPVGSKDMPDDDLPVTQISWNDAKEYCQWAGKKLPTEAQWEKSARGKDGSKYPWGNEAPDDSIANFNQFNDDLTPVKQFDKGQSFFGVFDMAGNAMEWCRDGYVEYNHRERPSNNPFEKPNKYRVVKGSAYLEGPTSLRSARRQGHKPDYSNNILGFRCVKEIEKE